MPPPPGSGSLRVAVWLLGVETLALTVLVGLLAYADLTAAAQSARGAVASTIFAAALTAALGALTVALYRRRRWARGPAIVLQLLLLPIGYTMVTGGAAWLGVPTLICGLASAASLLAPATRAALGLPGGT
jgi:phosphoglycerol transferase MdoB-like AlkP superfamily enzyme